MARNRAAARLLRSLPLLFCTRALPNAWRLKLKNRLRPRAPETLDFADRLSLFAKDTLLIELAVEQATEDGDTAGGEGYRDRAAKAPRRDLRTRGNGAAARS